MDEGLGKETVVERKQARGERRKVVKAKGRKERWWENAFYLRAASNGWTLSKRHSGVGRFPCRAGRTLTLRGRLEEDETDANWARDDFLAVSASMTTFCASTVEQNTIRWKVVLPSFPFATSSCKATPPPPRLGLQPSESSHTRDTDGSSRIDPGIFSHPAGGSRRLKDSAAECLEQLKSTGKSKALE